MLLLTTWKRVRLFLKWVVAKKDIVNESDIVNFIHIVTISVLQKTMPKLLSIAVSVRLMVTVLPLDLLASHIEKLFYRQRPNPKLSICVIAPQEDHNRVWIIQGKLITKRIISHFSPLDKKKYWSPFYNILGSCSHTQMVQIIII